MFLETKRVDVGPFADNTMKLVADVNPGSGPAQILFIRPYLPVPSALELRREWTGFQALLRAVVDYATQVVSIAESNLDEPKKPRELAAYLDGPFRAALTAQGTASRLNGPQLDQLVKTVRGKEDLLGALRAAQPAAEEILWLADQRANRIRALQESFGGEVGAKIDDAYAKVIANLRALEELQQQAMESYTLVARVRLGSQEALEAVRARDPAVRELLGVAGAPSRQALEASEAQLAERLARIEKLRDQIGPEIELYVRTKAELSRVIELSEGYATKGRLAVIAFTRSHRNLAAGLPVPPEIDVLGVLKSSAVNTASAVLP